MSVTVFGLPVRTMVAVGPFEPTALGALSLVTPKVGGDGIARYVPLDTVTLDTGHRLVLMSWKQQDELTPTGKRTLIVATYVVREPLR